MRRDEILGEIDVCQDCMLTDSQGEYPADRDETQPEPWALIAFGYRATPGGEHADRCVNRDAVTRVDDCDCDERGFSWTSCDGCGSQLEGDRYRFTMWRVTTEYAQTDARRHAALARESRVAGNLADARQHLARVAEWRAYLARIAASDRRFRMSMARMSRERAA